MSVNEVKIKQATTAFQVRGTGPPTSRTFAIGDEDHTLGNAARHILMQDERVSFAGYSVPHPSEPIVHIRVQTNPTSDCTAVEALKDACQTLDTQSSEVMDRLEALLPEVKEDRLQNEKRILEELAEDNAMAEGSDEDQDAGDDQDADPMDEE
jgi:DNA-directed RNA polymerase I and III subunit RPAC2